MTEAAQLVIPITNHRRVFKHHKDIISAVTVFLDGRRMVTGSHDRTLILWDLKEGTVLKKMEGHRSQVEAVAVSGDGKFIASGDDFGELFVWDGDTGESLTQAIRAHFRENIRLDFSPDSVVLATVSSDRTIKFWRTDTWDVQQGKISTDNLVNRVLYSPSGKFLAIATTNDIQIWDPSELACIAKFKADNWVRNWHNSLAWTPDGTRLLSLEGNTWNDSIIYEWDTSTWKLVGEVWRGHRDGISDLAVNSTGTLVASVGSDAHVRLWRLSDRRTIAIFKTGPYEMHSVRFSLDGKHVLCGGGDWNITEWDIPEDALLEDNRKERVPDNLQNNTSEEQEMNNARDFHSKVLFINTTVRDACLTRNLSTAQELITQQIDVDGKNFNAYANRSFVLARKCNWDNALHDALRSVSIQPSLTGYITLGIALCGKGQFEDATKAFDLTFMFTGADSKTILLILLVKATALFNANQHKEAILRIQELTAICPNDDTLACHVVEAYLRIQLGISALDDARHNEAADHFTAAIDTGVLSYEQGSHSKYEVFVVLFGWNLESSWQIANQNRCMALLGAGRLVEAHEAYKYMMDMCDEVTKGSCLEWSIAFKKECRELYAANGVPDLIASGDAALASSNYDRSIELYSAEIDLDSTTDTVFAKRCKAKLEKKLWEEALLDAQKAIEINFSFYLGYQLKHAALHGAQRYDEAIEVLETMTSKLDGTPDTPLESLWYQRSASRSKVEGVFKRAIDAQMENTPPRLIDTSTGRLCNRDAQINSFKVSTEYKELLSLTMANLQSERIQDVVPIFFQYVMLSHRWEGKEPLLHDIHGKCVYELDPVDCIAKLQSFCKVARDRGYRWAWSDTCCIDKNHIVDLQESVNSMFVWYRHSALTIVYLSDVLPSSKSGALATSAWNSRGWTVQEFLAPRVILFYQKDWTLYLDDRSPNHKESAEIIQELGDATGIDVHALVAFRPEMRGAREKLQWSSMRVTTLQEDIAYSLFGIFGVHLSPIYGEKKQNALGRLLQEIVAQSGDITCLDWVGKSSEFNSCLPANITPYAAPPSVLPSLSEDEMETSVSLLRDAGAVELASQLYTALDRLTAPRFAHRRLHLPCIVFTVIEVTPRPGQGQGAYFTYEAKADGLRDLLITTKDQLIPFSRKKPIRQKLLLVRPWDRNLMDLYDSNFVELEGDAQSMMTGNDRTSPGSPLYDYCDIGPGDNVPVDSESDSRALQLVVRLGQPFTAFLLAQQRGGEYKRIAADHDIIAQVKDMTSVRDMMDVRTLEIL